LRLRRARTNRNLELGAITNPSISAVRTGAVKPTKPTPVRLSRPRPRMKRKIVGYHLDAENYWVANLECGHAQHVRHARPFVERPWVMTEVGRASRLARN
jgi:Protein of unknown function (DUF3565)